MLNAVRRDVRYTARDPLTGTNVRHDKATDKVRIDVSIAILAMMSDDTDSPAPRDNHPVQKTKINALPYLMAL